MFTHHSPIFLCITTQEKRKMFSATVISHSFQSEVCKWNSIVTMLVMGSLCHIQQINLLMKCQFHLVKLKLVTWGWCLIRRWEYIWNDIQSLVYTWLFSLFFSYTMRWDSKLNFPYKSSLTFFVFTLGALKKSHYIFTRVLLAKQYFFWLLYQHSSMSLTVKRQKKITK